MTVALVNPARSSESQGDAPSNEAAEAAQADPAPPSSPPFDRIGRSGGPT
jgi:hypothetical protein